MFTIYKKGSLNISVEAIIILILAITMLGLGLGFIKKYFGDISGEIGNLIKEQPEPRAPNFNEPITLSKEVVSVAPGGTTGIKVSIFNPSGDLWEARPEIKCVIPTNSPAETVLATEVLSRPIESQKSETFEFIFTMDQGANLPKDYVCQISAPNMRNEAGDLISANKVKDLRVTVTG